MRVSGEKATIEARLRELAVEEHWLKKPADDGDATARRCIELIRRDRESLQRKLIMLESQVTPIPRLPLPPGRSTRGN